MASAQVLPSSRKLGHLEAGKKKLEEFRKKKAEGRAKKAASTGQLISFDTDQYEKSSRKDEHVRDGAKTSSANDPYGSAVADKAVNSSQSISIGSSSKTLGSSPMLSGSDHTLFGESVNNSGKGITKLFENSGFSELANGHYDEWRREDDFNHNMDTLIAPSDGGAKDQFDGFQSVKTNENFNMNNNDSSFHSFINTHPGEDNFSKVHISYPETSNSLSTSDRERVSGQNSLEIPNSSANLSGLYKESSPGVGLYRPDSMYHKNAMDFDFGGGKVADSFNNYFDVDSAHLHASKPPSNDLSLSYKATQSQYSFSSPGYGTNSGRSRPSFLDSLGVSRAPSMDNVPYSEPKMLNTPISFDISKVNSTEVPSSSPAQTFAEFNTADQSLMSVPSDKELSMGTSGFSNDGKQLKQGTGDHHAVSYNQFISKKDENFATLEQYIEDLTQEKFSLQRALETSRTLAESLAAENSSLTESYNQQGQVVSQLKSDIERLQEEIKAQLLEVEAVRLEYANAQLECNAADERAKILASEVIGLEEKALRLRSNELKLEKQMEYLNSEVASYKRKVSILEKERQDFQSTIDAMQEEKKLLQSKLRKASSNEKVNDSKKNSARRDVSTSTEDLAIEPNNLVDGGTSIGDRLLNITVNQVQDSATMLPSSDASLSPVDGAFFIPDASRDIPHDQFRMIANINSLISELALEKEELVGALRIESSNCTKLKDLNKDLSQKLEAQTQRLELLTAQRMANENVLSRPVDTHSMQDSTEYADEGDEVVERVLGWIMKLFPGGPSKRRTSKLL